MTSWKKKKLGSTFENVLFEKKPIENIGKTR